MYGADFQFLAHLTDVLDQVAGLLCQLPADVGADRIVCSLLVPRPTDRDPGTLTCRCQSQKTIPLVPA